jgi:hypothetical protein
MIDNMGSELKVRYWGMTETGWEFYLEEKNSEGYFGLVCGNEQELGYVNLDEIKPYLISFCSLKKGTVHNIMPPDNWRWKSS